MKAKTLFTVSSAILAGTITSSSYAGDTLSWTGTTDTSWDVSDNWNIGTEVSDRAPQAGDSVDITWDSGSSTANYIIQLEAGEIEIASLNVSNTHMEDGALGVQGLLGIEAAGTNALTYIKIGTTDEDGNFTAGNITTSGRFAIGTQNWPNAAKAVYEFGDFITSNLNWQRQSVIGSNTTGKVSTAIIANSIQVNQNGQITIGRVGTVTYDGTTYYSKIGSIGILSPTGTPSWGNISFKDIGTIEVGNIYGAGSGLFKFSSSATADAARLILTGSGDFGGQFVPTLGKTTIEIAAGAVQNFTQAQTLTDKDDTNITYDVKGTLSIMSSSGLHMIIENGGIVSNYSKAVEMSYLTFANNSTLVCNIVDASTALYSVTGEIATSSDWANDGNKIAIELTNVGSNETVALISFASISETSGISASDFYIATSGYEDWGLQIIDNVLYAGLNIPEPSTYAGIFGIAALLLAAYSKKNKRN